MIRRFNAGPGAQGQVLQYLLLALIIFIGAALRFYKLGEWSFWSDEMFTVEGKEDGFNYTFLRQSLSLELIQITVGLFGINEWNARLVPALIGLVSIPALYFPIRKMFNPTVSLAAALLLAVSPWHLYWSQNARFYVALLLLYNLALLAFYFALEDDRPLYYLLSLVLLGLAVKERLLALFFIPVILGYLVSLVILPFEKPVGLRRWRNLVLFFMLPSLILALLFARPYLLNFSGWMYGFGFANNSPLWLLTGIVFYLGVPTVCAGGLGALYLLRQKSRAGLLLSLGAGAPVLLLVAVAPFHYTANRYVFMILVSWLILAAVAAVELLRQAPQTIKVLAMSALVLLLLDPLVSNILYYRYQNGNRDNWKGALTWVREHKQDGDLVVTMNRELGDYYLQDKTIHFQELDITDIADNGTRAWFVEDMTVQTSLPEVSAWLEQNARLVANFDVHVQARNFKMRVYVYDLTKNLVETGG